MHNDDQSRKPYIVQAAQDFAARTMKTLATDVAGYAEEGPTFDPAGDYLCGTCDQRLEPNHCATVRGKISLTIGGCILYRKGEQMFDKPLARQFQQVEVIYTERPQAKGFGCKRCQYSDDGHCEVWNIEVEPNACCFKNEGEDDVWAPGDDQ